MLKSFRGLTLFFSAFLSVTVFAQSWDEIPGLLPLKANSSPLATDLVQAGEPVDPLDLKLKLQRLSPEEQAKLLLNLDPNPGSDLWRRGGFSNADSELNVNLEDSFSYASEQASRSGNFRFVATQKSSQGSLQSFTFFVSKEIHTMLLRKALLRKLGYQIPPMKRVAQMHLRFNSPAARELFTQRLAEATFGDPKRWIVSETAEELVLQDLVVMEPQSRYFNLALGYLPRAYFKERRLLRSLISAYELTDLQESVNLLPWNYGRVINGYLKLGYSDAAEFDLNYDDARWLAREISKLSRLDFEQIVAAAELPEPVSRLLVEKLISRRNDMLQHFSLPRIQRDEAKPNISFGADLVDGKLQKEFWPGYGSRFSFKDPESPLSSEELFAFGRSKFYSNLLSNLIIQVNTKIIPSTEIQEKVIEHQIEKAKEAFFKSLSTGELQSIPYGYWGFPVFGGNVIASRDVVVGSYLGTDNQVQLADAVGLSVNAGYYLGVDGIPTPWQVAGLAQATLTRVYTHLRPIKSIKAALKYPFKNILVPLFKKEYSSYFDKLASADFETLPQEEKDKILKEVLTRFQENLSVGESLIISDSISAGAQGSVGYGIADHVSLSGQLSANHLVVSRLHIMRADENTVHVYKDLGNVTGFRGAMTLKARLPVLRLSASTEAGRARVKFFSLVLNEKDPQSLRNARLLREVLKTNSIESLEAVQKPFVLKSVFDQDLGRSGILWFKWAHLKTSNNMSVQRPDNSRERRFYKFHKSSMQGKDFENLGVDILNAIIQEFTQEEIYLSTANTGRPGDTFQGSSLTRNLSLDAELDNPEGEKIGFFYDPFISVRYNWRGWSISREKAEDILKQINKRNAFPLYTDLSLGNTKKILFYNIELFYNIYAAGIASMLDLDESQVRNIFETYKVKSLERVRHRRSAGGKLVRVQKENIVNEFQVFRKRYQKAKSHEDASAALTQMMSLAEAYLSKDGLFALMGGEQNVYIASKIQGFREGDENGNNTFFSNSLGEFGSRLVSGPLENVRSQIGMSESEFYIYWLLERL